MRWLEVGRRSRTYPKQIVSHDATPPCGWRRRAWLGSGKESNLAEVTHEMVEHYLAAMDGDVDAGDPDSDDVREWLAKFRPATHAKPLPARALGPTVGKWP
jgi:hypothetical protein